MSLDPVIPCDPGAQAIVPRTAALWHDIDLHWAYTEPLPGIRRRVGCRERARDVLHDALLRTALAQESGPKEQPHVYLRTGGQWLEHFLPQNR